MNSFFIGLGGAGVYSVAEFAQKIRNHGSNVGNTFAYLDTDMKSLEDFPFIRPDYIQLSGKDRNKGHSIENLIKNSTKLAVDPNISDNQKKKHIQFLRWYDQNIVSNEELSKGAEGIRMLSRAMLFADYTIIRKKLAEKLTYVDPADGQMKIRKIYVVSGTCGGTGSGIVIDILYMLNEIRKSQNIMANQMPINLLLVMPQGYINGTKDTSSLFNSYRLNAYALIDEINACLKDYYGFYKETDKTIDATTGEVTINVSVGNAMAGKQFNKYRCCDNEVPSFNFDVFQNAFLFDSVTAEGFPMTHEQRSENVANFLFTLEVGSAASATLDMHISNNIRTEKFNSANAPFIKGFAATGMYVAQTWEELTKKYVREKFMYQMLHYGFVGEGAVADEVLLPDTLEYGGRIQGIISNRITNTEGDGIDDLLAKILAGYNYDDLGEVLKRIQSSLTDKHHHFDSIFANCNEKETVNALCKAMDFLLSEVREETYESCQKWAKMYNLNHALQLVRKVDNSYDRQFKEKARAMSDYKIEWYVMNKAEKRRNDCMGQLKEYINYLVYRNLSNEEDGYLDDCKKCLTAAITVINLNEFKIDDVKVEDWESKYIKYLNDLSNDSTRSVWPSLDNLYNKENACLVRGNDVERDYASLVSQSNDGTAPDLTYKLDNNELLYTYKNQCLVALSSQNGRWDDFFKMQEGPSVFARNIRVAFEAFIKEVRKVGMELSRSASLSKPFSQLSLTQPEQTRLTNTIEGFNRITVATQYQMDDNPSIGIYVADFNQMAWLQGALFPAGNAAMDKTRVQDDTLSDRIVKLYVEFGHPIDNYRYYYDVYQPYFKNFYDGISKSRARHHQPYIDQRFLTEGKGDLAQFFTIGVENEEIKNLRNGLLKGQTDTFLKFCSLFLYKTLMAYKDSGIISEKNMRPKDFFSRTTKPKKKQIITFDLTNDFDHWKDHETYEPSGRKFTIDFNKDYKESSFKEFSECFDFWKRFLNEMENQLDHVRLEELFTQTREECKAPRDRLRAEFLEKLNTRYIASDSAGSPIVRWKDMFDDFLKVFPYNGN